MLYQITSKSREHTSLVGLCGDLKGFQSKIGGSVTHFALKGRVIGTFSLFTTVLKSSWNGKLQTIPARFWAHVRLVSNSLTIFRYLYLYQWIPYDTQFFFYYSGIRLLFNQSDDVLPSSLFDPVTLAGFCLCAAQSTYLLPCSNLIAVTSGHDLGHHFCR